MWNWDIDSRQIASSWNDRTTYERTYDLWDSPHIPRDMVMFPREVGTRFLWGGKRMVERLRSPGDEWGLEGYEMGLFCLLFWKRLSGRDCFILRVYCWGRCVSDCWPVRYQTVCSTTINVWSRIRVQHSVQPPHNYSKSSIEHFWHRNMTRTGGGMVSPGPE